MKKGARTIIIIAGAALAAAAALGASYHYSSGFRSWLESNLNGSQDSGGTDESGDTVGNVDIAIESHGIGVKFLNTTTDGQGNVVKTFSYSIEPSDATDKDVLATIGWVDTGVSDPIGNYLTVALDSAASTVSVTCKAAFSHQAALKLVSDWQPPVSATVTIDYVKKFLGFNAANASTQLLDLSARTAQDCGQGKIIAGWQGDNASVSKGYSAFSKDASLPITYSAAFASAEIVGYTSLNPITPKHLADLDSRWPAKIASADAAILSGLSGTYTGATAISAIQSFITGLTTTFKNMLYGYNFLYIGFVAAGTVTATCSGQTASSAVTAYEYAPASSYTIATPTTALTPEVGEIDF